MLGGEKKAREKGKKNSWGSRGGKPTLYDRIRGSNVKKDRQTTGGENGKGEVVGIIRVGGTPEKPRQSQFAWERRGLKR